MSLIIVLTLSMFLLIFGGAYIKANQQNRPINERHLERIQADFIAQGVIQLAVLKFKKRPAEFYWAYKTMSANLSNAPYAAYVTQDPTLNGTFTAPGGLRYVYSTDWRLVTNDLFTTDGIVITVTVRQETSGGVVVLTRQSQTTIQADRRTL